MRSPNQTDATGRERPRTRRTTSPGQDQAADEDAELGGGAGPGQRGEELVELASVEGAARRGSAASD